MQCEKFEKLDILIDNLGSWMWEYIGQIEQICKKYSKNVRIFKHSSEIENGDVMFILSCDRILKKNSLLFHKHNIVIHASDLPNGKGWSPWTWEIESGADEIVLTLFEADEKLDGGDWYIKDRFSLEGTELIDDVRRKLFDTEAKMIADFLELYPLDSKKQAGEESFYARRYASNQELDTDLPLSALFNKLRVCDNERYPAHFFIEQNGKKQKYIIKVYKDLKCVT